jgi:predicted nucleic acid-binding protein
MPVVDASIVVDWVAPGVSPGTSAGRLLARLAEESTPILAPRLLLEETANALVTGIRRQRWSGAEADASFLLLRRLPVELVDQPRDLDRAYELSRRYDEHPVYDLVYVAVAERLGEQLVTADDALRHRLASLPFVIGPD